jgi:hypothetical protein
MLGQSLRSRKNNVPERESDAQTTESSEKAGLASKMGCGLVEFLPLSHRPNVVVSLSPIFFSPTTPKPHNTVTMENERGELVDLYESPIIP